MLSISRCIRWDLMNKKKSRNERRKSIRMKLVVKYIHTQHRFCCCWFHMNYINYRSNSNFPRRLQSSEMASQSSTNEIKSRKTRIQFSHFGEAKSQNLFSNNPHLKHELWMESSEEGLAQPNYNKLTTYTYVQNLQKKENQNHRIVNKTPASTMTNLFIRILWQLGQNGTENDKFRSHCASTEINRFGRTQKTYTKPNAASYISTYEGFCVCAFGEYVCGCGNVRNVLHLSMCAWKRYLNWYIPFVCRLIWYVFVHVRSI